MWTTASDFFSKITSQSSFFNPVLDREKSDDVTANHLAYFLYALAALQLLIMVMFAYLARSYTYRDDYEDDDISEAIAQRHPYFDQGPFPSWGSSGSTPSWHSSGSCSTNWRYINTMGVSTPVARILRVFYNPIVVVPASVVQRAERRTRDRQVPGSKLARAIWFFL